MTKILICTISATPVCMLALCIYSRLPWIVIKLVLLGHQILIYKNTFTQQADTFAKTSTWVILIILAVARLCGLFSSEIYAEFKWCPNTNSCTYNMCTVMWKKRVGRVKTSKRQMQGKKENNAIKFNLWKACPYLLKLSLACRTLPSAGSSASDTCLYLCIEAISTNKDIMKN